MSLSRKAVSRKAAFLFLTGLTLGSGSAWALDPIPGVARFEEILPTQQRGGAELGYTTIDGEQFSTITPRLDLNLGKIGVGIQVPLNIRSPLGRKPGAGKKDYWGVIRYEDWDDTAEWLKVLRYVRLGHKRDPWYLRAGELAADIGHGTIMGRYLNNLDPNNFRLGLQVDVNTDWGGVETIINDLGGNLDPEASGSQIVGGRIYLKPWAFVDSESVLNVFSLGLTAIIDRNAPFTRRHENGDEVRTGVKSQRVWGVDFEVDVLSNPLVDLTPYTDLNFISQAGMGWHLGVLSKIKLPIGLDLQLPIRLEYRHFEGDYVPTYFSTFYDKERSSYPGSAAASQSYHFRKDRAGEDSLQGYYADMAFDFVGLIQLGAFYEGYFSGDLDPNVAVFVNVPALEMIQFKAYYERRGVEGADDLFTMDDKSYAIAQGRLEIFNPLYLLARAEQRWVDEDQDGAFEQAEPEIYFGLEFSANF